MTKQRAIGRTSKKKPREPDFRALERIGAEMESLQAVRKWDREAFRRLFAEAKIAVAGEDEYLEFLLNEAESGWVDDAE